MEFFRTGQCVNCYYLETYQGISYCILTEAEVDEDGYCHSSISVNDIDDKLQTFSP